MPNSGGRRAFLCLAGHWGFLSTPVKYIETAQEESGQGGHQN